MTDAADPLSPALDNVTATMVAQLQSDDPKRFAVVKRLLTIAQMLKREMGTPRVENFRQQPAQGMFVNGIDQLFDEDDNHVRPIGAGGFALQDVADLQRNTLMVAQEALEVQKRKLERKKSKPGDDYPSRLRKLAKALKTCVSAYDAMYGSSFRAAGSDAMTNLGGRCTALCGEIAALKEESDEVVLADVLRRHPPGAGEGVGCGAAAVPGDRREAPADGARGNGGAAQEGAAEQVDGGS